MSPIRNILLGILGILAAPLILICWLVYALYQTGESIIDLYRELKND